jgi:small subunit ribosomal protein S4
VRDFLDVEHNKMSAKLTRVPTLTDVPYPTIMEPNLVIEFYSR